MAKTRVIILAAGKGTRMKSDVPKPLVPVAGKPMIEHLLESVRASGVDEKPIVVVGAWSEEAFRAQLGETVEYAVQTEQLGTGHAVACAKHLAGEAENIIVLYGDHPFLCPEIVRGLESMQEAFPGSVAMLTAVVPEFEGDYKTFERWGRIIRDDDGEVIAIREAKDCLPEELEITEVNPALFAFPAAWAWIHLEALKNENASGEYYLTDLIAMAMAEGKEIATASADPLDVIGINSPEELARAEKVFGSVNKKIDELWATG